MRVAVWAGALLLLTACQRDNPAYQGEADGGTAADSASPDSSTGQGCTPETLACSGLVLLKCTAEGTWTVAEHCPTFCTPGDPAHCGGFFASNGLPKCGHEETGLPSFSVDTGKSIIIDTDTFTVGGTIWPEAARAEVVQTDGPAIAVFKFDDFMVPAGAAVRAQGTRALAIWAYGQVVIAGALRAGADRLSPTATLAMPAGAWTSQAGWTAGPGGTGENGSGCGGGGHIAAGGSGGKGPPPTALAGAPGGGGFGSDALVPLRGGSPGAGIVNGRGAAPGGGAIHIVACRGFTLRAGGVVSASGTGGGPGMVVPIPGNHVLYGGDGGGSGGAILIESPLINLAAAVTANGGGGGAGGALVSSSTPEDLRGEDGHEDDQPALGGAPGSLAGAGGVGGALGAAAGGAGGDPTGDYLYTGGGGGGAAGRIRFNVTTAVGPDVALIMTGAVVSPEPSVGQQDIW